MAETAMREEAVYEHLHGGYRARSGTGIRGGPCRLWNRHGGLSTTRRPRPGRQSVGELRSIAMLNKINGQGLALGIALLSMSWAILALDAAPAMAAPTNAWAAAAR